MWLVALLFALVAYRRGRLAASGALFAVAALLRLFPAALLAGLLAQNLASRERRALLRRHAPLYAAAALTVAVLVAATSLVPTPDGGNPWAAFAARLALLLIAVAGALLWPRAIEILDFRYHALSALVGTYFAAVFALRIRDPGKIA